MSETPTDRPNDPRKTEYEEPRAAIVRSEGGTPSERYLAKLGDRSFLNLWSYPNTFIDKKNGPKSDGKELCDLLVVCGDHILIFSDKTIGWPTSEDDQLAWKRWYKRAILKSVDQIRGAERWIAMFPDRIFIDRQCTQRLPLQLPPPERRKVHGIVVALGAGGACRKHFGEGIGSLLIAAGVKGGAHWKAEVLPFVVGDVDPGGPFVHVLDDATLDIVMGELDTITDLTDYLSKKEKIIRSERLISAGGEEDLVAYFMTHMNRNGEHDFTMPDGSDIGENQHITLQNGFYEHLTKDEQYQAKKSADQSSYVWDRLIEMFTTPMLAGTTIVPNGQPFILSEVEEAVRHMALVPRFKRRAFGDAILGALDKGRLADRFTRAMVPGPTEPLQDTGFFFMTLAIPKFELSKGYEGYRAARRGILETYAFALLQKDPRLKRVIGIATEPPSDDKKTGSSEDLIMAEAGEWGQKFLEDLEERKQVLNIFQEGNYAEYRMEGNEFPEIQKPKMAPPTRKSNRRRRQEEKAEARRQWRKRK